MKPQIFITSLLLGLLAVPSPAHAQDPVNIPDPYLANGVRNALGLPAGTPVTPDLMLNLQSVTAASTVCFGDGDDDDDDDSSSCLTQPIVSLTGLEHAHNLSTLWLYGAEHAITDLEPIKGLTRLRTLSLSQAIKATGDTLQSATEVIGGLTGLTQLNLSLDGLEDRHVVPLAPLTDLTQLDLSHNRLTDLAPLMGMVRLQSLNLFANQITDLTPLQALNRLESLSLGVNPIVDLSPLAGMQRLSGLELSGVVKDLHSLPPLRRLSSLSTNATDLGPLARLNRLLYLTLSGVYADLTPLANLEQLVLLHPGTTGIEDLTPLALATAYQPNNSSLAWLAAVDLALPSNAAVVEHWHQTGVLPRNIQFPQSLTWKPDHFIPDGSLRNVISSILGIPPDQLQPGDLTTALDTNGQPLRQVGFGSSPPRSLEGLQHASSLNLLIATGGRIVDLSPLGGLNLTNASLYLNANLINDVTPLVGKPFTVLDLRDNPINPATVPVHWWTDERVKLDPRRVASPLEAIPDEGLRAAIRIALSLAPAAPVLASDVQRLEFLHAEGRRIESLAGLEIAANLKGLALRNNVIASLTPLSGLAGLQWVRLSGNVPDQAAQAVIDTLRTRGVRVDDDPNGRFLSAITPVNGVVFADAYQLSSLRYLQLFPQVRELFLSGNHLRDITILGTLPQLERVHLAGNLLRLEPGSPARTTADALVARGVVVTIDPQRPEATLGSPLPDEALQRAIADAAELPVVPAGFTQAQLEAVTDLDWERTFPVVRPPLSNPDLLRQLPNLTRLSLENARLTGIGFVSNLSKLTSLDLDFNTITDLTPLAGLVNLVELDINNNGQLTDVGPLASLTALEKLDLDQNNIFSISAFSSLVKLTEIDLHANNVSDLTPLAGLSALSMLDLKDNQIRDAAPLAGLTNLVTLDLRFNRVATLAPLRSLTSLRDLEIEHNNIILDAVEMGYVDQIRQASPFAEVDIWPQFYPAPRLLSSAEGQRLEWWGELSTYYWIMASDDLVTWRVIGGEIGNGATVSFLLPATTSLSQYYRVIQ